VVMPFKAGAEEGARRTSFCSTSSQHPAEWIRPIIGFYERYST
jgi:hypothetical protein